MRRTSPLVAVILALTACKSSSKSENADVAPSPTAAAPTASAPAASATPAPAASATPAPAASATPTPAASATPTATTPFAIEHNGKRTEYPEACLTQINPPFTIMIAKRPGAEACAVSGEDDYAVMLEMPLCGADAKTCALPAPGATVEAKLTIVAGFEGTARLTVVRHEKPWVVFDVQAEGGDEGAFSSIGGLLRVKAGDNPLLDPASWK